MKIPQQLLAPIVGVLAGCFGIGVGLIIRQPEINELHRQVAKLQKKADELKETVRKQNEDVYKRQVDCSPTMKRLAFNAYLAAAGDGMVIVPVKLDSTVMRGTALTVSAIESISDALRVPTCLLYTSRCV